MNIGAIILAAGYSSRMVDFKPLLQIGGKTIIERCIDLFKTCEPEQTIVVTGHRAKEVEKAVGTSAVSVFNPDFAGGMYSSICRGVQSLDRGLDGFFLLPVDIPLIRHATIDILRASFDGSAVLYPLFKDRRGHPPLIPTHYIPDILAYHGEGGLKRLLRTFPSNDIPVWDRTILMDMDTQDDYTALSRFHTTMDIGTREEVLLLAHATLPARGFAHGKAVAEIALKLGEALSPKGLDLNLDLLHNSGLLHDIAKGQPNHEQAGGKMVGRLGLTGLARCIHNHRDCCTREAMITEAELVCLADKLVRGVRPVSVQQRFDHKLEMYTEDEEACLAIKRRLTTSLQLQERVETISGQSIDTILGRQPA